MKNNNKMKITNEMKNNNKMTTNITKTSSKVSKMSYSESEPNFSNFAINSLSTFAPIFSEFESESDESEYICVFLPYICILLNKLADDSF